MDADAAARRWLREDPGLRARAAGLPAHLADDRPGAARSGRGAGADRPDAGREPASLPRRRLARPTYLEGRRPPLTGSVAGTRPAVRSTAALPADHRRST